MSRQRFLYNDLSYNGFYTTITYNGFYTTVFIQRFLYNGLYTTILIQRFLYNDSYTTISIQRLIIVVNNDLNTVVNNDYKPVIPLLTMIEKLVLTMICTIAIQRLLYNDYWLILQRFVYNDFLYNDFYTTILIQRFVGATANDFVALYENRRVGSGPQKSFLVGSLDKNRWQENISCQRFSAYTTIFCIASNNFGRWDA